MARATGANSQQLVFFLAACTAVTITLLLCMLYTNTSGRQHVRAQETGYIMALKYSDQLTGGAVNLLSLMCLATEFGGLKVVEPFVVNSDLGLNTSKKWTTQMKFRDIYDMSKWMRYVSTKHYNHLVPYQTFIRNAPSKVLLVQYHYPCGDQKTWDVAREFCNSNGFELLGILCLTNGKEETFTVEMLRVQIYSQYHPSEIVVLFDIFGGISARSFSSAAAAYRLPVTNTKCVRNDFAGNAYAVQPSQSVISDANAYIQKYLNTGPSYISVMIRLESILQQYHPLDSEQSVIQCLRNILERLKAIKYRTGINSIFVSIDVGVFGSRGLHNPKMKRAILPPVEQFFSTLYDNKISLQEWENSFSNVGLGHTGTAGYIAMMQKAIAAKGDILILAGSKLGSSFQTTSKYLYRRIHGPGQVIELGSDCL